MISSNESDEEDTLESEWHPSSRNKRIRSRSLPSDRAPRKERQRNECDLLIPIYYPIRTDLSRSRQQDIIVRKGSSQPKQCEFEDDERVDSFDLEVPSRSRHQNTGDGIMVSGRHVTRPKVRRPSYQRWIVRTRRRRHQRKEMEEADTISDLCHRCWSLKIFNTTRCWRRRKRWRKRREKAQPPVSSVRHHDVPSRLQNFHHQDSRVGSSKPQHCHTRDQPSSRRRVCNFISEVTLFFFVVGAGVSSTATFTMISQNPVFWRLSKPKDKDEMDHQNSAMTLITSFCHHALFSICFWLRTRRLLFLITHSTLLHFLMSASGFEPED